MGFPAWLQYRRDGVTAALALEKARRYLDTADLVRRHGDYDTAVSRLYYAMFYCAEAVLLARGLSFSKHQAVIAAFGQQFAKTKLLPGHALEKRHLADLKTKAVCQDKAIASRAPSMAPRCIRSATEERL